MHPGRDPTHAGGLCALVDPQADRMEVYATPLWAMLGWFEPGDIDACAGQCGKKLL